MPRALVFGSLPNFSICSSAQAECFDFDLIMFLFVLAFFVFVFGFRVLLGLAECFNSIVCRVSWMWSAVALMAAPPRDG